MGFGSLLNLHQRLRCIAFAEPEMRLGRAQLQLGLRHVGHRQLHQPQRVAHIVIDGRGRLITATIPGRGRAQDAQRHFDYFLRYLRRTFPGLAGVPIELESYWTGMTANSSAVYDAAYPQFYRVADGVLALLNLGSWGNLMGPLLGMHLAQVLAEDRPEQLLLPLREPRSVRCAGLFETKIRRVLIPAARLADRLGLV